MNSLLEYYKYLLEEALSSRFKEFTFTAHFDYFDCLTIKVFVEDKTISKTISKYDLEDCGEIVIDMIAEDVLRDYLKTI